MRRIVRISRILAATALIAVPGIAMAQTELDRGDVERSDRGFDIGWIGLLGLGGLAGLMGREKNARYGVDTKTAAGRL